MNLYNYNYNIMSMQIPKYPRPEISTTERDSIEIYSIEYSKKSIKEYSIIEFLSYPENGERKYDFYESKRTKFLDVYRLDVYAKYMLIKYIW